MQVFCSARKWPSIVRHARYRDSGVLTINYETMGKNLTPDNNSDKKQITAKVKEQFKQKVGSPKAIETLGRMLMHKQSKQKAGSPRAVQTRGRMLM